MRFNFNVILHHLILIYHLLLLFSLHLYYVPSFYLLHMYVLGLYFLSWWNTQCGIYNLKCACWLRLHVGSLQVLNAFIFLCRHPQNPSAKFLYLFNNSSLFFPSPTLPLTTTTLPSAFVIWTIQSTAYKYFSLLVLAYFI